MGSLIWIKFRRLVQNDMSSVAIWSKLKPQVEFQYGRRLTEFNGMLSQHHMSHCRVLPPGEFNVMSPQSHVPHCRVKEFYHIIANCSFSPYFIFMFSQCSLSFGKRWLSIHLYYSRVHHDCLAWAVEWQWDCERPAWVMLHAVHCQMSTSYYACVQCQLSDVCSRRSDWCTASVISQTYITSTSSVNLHI